MNETWGTIPLPPAPPCRHTHHSSLIIAALTVPPTSNHPTHLTNQGLSPDSKTRHQGEPRCTALHLHTSRESKASGSPTQQPENSRSLPPSDPTTSRKKDANIPNQRPSSSMQRVMNKDRFAATLTFGPASPDISLGLCFSTFSGRACRLGRINPKVAIADASVWQQDRDNYIQTATCNATWRQCTTTVQLTQSTILIIRTEESLAFVGFLRFPHHRDVEPWIQHFSSFLFPHCQWGDSCSLKQWNFISSFNCGRVHFSAHCLKYLFD